MDGGCRGAITLDDKQEDVVVIGEEGTGAQLSSCVYSRPPRLMIVGMDLPPPKLLTTASSSP